MLNWVVRTKLEDLRSFIFSEHADGKIADDTAKELVTQLDKLTQKDN